MTFYSHYISSQKPLKKSYFDFLDIVKNRLQAYKQKAIAIVFSR